MNSFMACSNPKSTDSPVEKTEPARIISLHGSITEILFELGLGDQIVGLDVTSTFPADCEKLPKLGHVQQLNPEGIMALNPTIVFVEEAMIESQVLQTLAKSDIKIMPIKIGRDLSAPIEAAKQIVAALAIDKSSLINKLEEKIEANKKELENLKAAQVAEPKVLFIYARGAKTLMVSGKNTPIDAMIQLAGGQNAIREFEDFKPLTPEALLQATPDVILLFDSGLQSLADTEHGVDALQGLLNIPGIATTPAAKSGRIISMDGQYLSGFGPRVGKAAIELAEALSK